MPRNDACSHPACAGGPCRALRPDELQISPEDRALAEELVTGGWIQISHKYRELKRWHPDVTVPTPEEMVAPEWRGTYFGQQALRCVAGAVGEYALRMAPEEMVERRTLTVTQFKAFKALVNKPWRDAQNALREWKADRQGGQ